MTATNRKNRLLRLSLKIFAEKGFGKATISEIAEAADVREAVIYQYFKGKEDLLFHIPVSTTTLIVDTLQTRISDLDGPANKVRQLIRFYLEFMETNPAYATVILFDLRGNRRFYRSPAYDAFRRFNQMVMGILNEGVVTGAFRSDVRLSLINNMLFGAMDHLILSWLMFNKPRCLIDQAGELSELILNAIQANTLSTQTHNGSLTHWGRSQRKAILKVAEHHFATKGYEKTTLAEVAATLNIGKAAIFENFKSKRKILFGISRQKNQALVNETSSGLQYNFQAEILLRRFVRHYLTYLQSIKNYLAILIFELKSNRRFYHSRSYQSFRRYNEELIRILSKGRQANIFSDRSSIYLCCHLIFGSVDHMALAWLLFHQPPSLLDQADELIKLFLQAVRRH